MVGQITASSQLSAYQPSDDVTRFTAEVQRDYQNGLNILEKSYVELNDRSVIEDMNAGQMMMNAFVDTSIDDPRDAWKYRGTRSKARNKAIAMVANLAGNILIPDYSAQNDADEVDRDFSEVMRDGIEWMTSPDISNYQSSFLQVVMNLMASPVTYMGAEYFDVMQEVKEMQEDGSYTKKQIRDRVLSGFQCPIYSATEILINNAYERNIQKQRRLIKRRWVEYGELEAKYGKHHNWIYVQAGQRSIYNDETGAFYDVKDSDHPTLVSEDTIYDRRSDLEVCFVGGIYMGDDDIDLNPIQHRDNFGAPKYNLVPFGYSRIGEHFFYYKSLMNCHRWDNDLYDAMTEVVMNRAFLEADIPVVITGTDDPESDMVFPGSVTVLSEKEAKMSALIPPANMAAGFSALHETAASMDEASVSPVVSGQLPDAQQKAYSVAQAQANSKRIIGVPAKSLAESVCLYGDLMKDIFLNHIAVPEIEELVGGGLKLKYRSLLVPQHPSTGRKKDKRIRFDESYIGMSATPEQKDQMEVELLQESGYPNHKESLIVVNPELVARFHYLTKVDPEEVFAKNAEYWQPILLNLIATMSNNPYADIKALTTETMYAFFQSRGDEFISKNPQPLQADTSSPYAIKNKTNPSSPISLPTAVT